MCKNLVRRNCKRKGFIKTPYCKIKKIWNPTCSNCEDKEYKVYKPIKPYSKKRAKAERERYSVFTNNLNLCIECLENKKEVAREDLHEIFNGKNRLKSMKYGLVAPLCRTCHNNQLVIEKWQKIGRQAFIKKYSEETFIKEFQTRKGE